MNEYMTNMWIDTIQNAKTSWVNTWVKDKEISKPLHDFIAAQTQFTKIAMKSIAAYSNATGEAMARAMK
jgi:hypothetical protein